MGKESNEKAIRYVEIKLSHYHRMEYIYRVLSKTIRFITIAFVFLGFSCPFLERYYNNQLHFLQFGYLIFLGAFLLIVLDQYLSITNNWARFSLVYNEIKSSYEIFLAKHYDEKNGFNHDVSDLLEEINDIIRSETIFWVKSYEIKPTYIENILKNNKL